MVSHELMDVQAEMTINERTHNQLDVFVVGRHKLNSSSIPNSHRTLDSMLDRKVV